MSPLPDDVKSNDPYWDNKDYVCVECESPVEGEAYEVWLSSLEPDEDGRVGFDRLLCWECYCSENAICTECASVLNQDLMCLYRGCDMFGRGQG